MGRRLVINLATKKYDSTTGNMDYWGSADVPFLNNRVEILKHPKSAEAFVGIGMQVIFSKLTMWSTKLECQFI